MAEIAKISKEDLDLLQNFIDSVGGKNVAAGILKISPGSLTKYLNSDKFSEETWIQIILPIITEDPKIWFKRLYSVINGLNREIRELQKYNMELRMESYKLRMSVNDQSKVLKAISENTIVGYLQKNYSLLDIDELYKLIVNVSNKKDIEKDEIIMALEKFAWIYEQFRPHKITSSDPYYGTVKEMDIIFRTLYRYMHINYYQRFSKEFLPPYERHFKQDKLNFEDISWDRLLNGIEYVSKRIKQTICKQAVKLYAIVGNDNEFQLQSYIEEYVNYQLNTDNASVELMKESDFMVKVNGIELKIENLYQFQQELYSLNR